RPHSLSQCADPPQDPPPFPTRRSSDLIERGRGLVMVADSLDALAAAIDGGDASGASARLPTRLFSTKRACASCGTSFPELDPRLDRKSTRLNSSHVKISYAVFCLKKKK